MRSRFVRQLLLVCCLSSMGCVSGFMDHYSGKYRSLLNEGTSQEQVRKRIGTPSESMVEGLPTEHSYEINNDHAYDAFRIVGKVHKPGDGSAQAMLCAITLGTGELISIPTTILKLLYESFQRHTLVVYYDESLNYSGHKLFDAKNKPEDTSGY